MTAPLRGALHSVLRGVLQSVLTRGLLCVAAMGFFAHRAQAYPQFIAHGYSSCAVCHVSAFGGGFLTDYGRALSAVEISARPPWRPRPAPTLAELGTPAPEPGAAATAGTPASPVAAAVPEADSGEDLAESFGFLGSRALPAWIRPAADYRGLLYASRVAGGGWQTRRINMQADLGAVLRSPDEHWTASLRGGYYPGRDEHDRTRFISREHSVRYQRSSETGEQWDFTLGFTDRVFGLRIVDHTSPSRTLTLTSQNDQVHNVTVHYADGPFETGVQLSAGNLYQDSDLRMPGASVSGEFEPREKLRVGASVAAMGNQYRRVLPASVHLRWGLPRTSFLLSEWGLVLVAPRAQGATPPDPGTLGNFALVQVGTQVVRGLEISLNGDWMSERAFAPSPRVLRAGPGLQYYPAQRIELRFDALASRSFLAANSRWRYTLLSQLHLSF